AGLAPGHDPGHARCGRAASRHRPLRERPDRLALARFPDHRDRAGVPIRTSARRLRRGAVLDGRADRRVRGGEPAVTPIRPLDRGDLDAVAGLYELVVRSGTVAPAPGLAEQFARTVLDHPWADDDLPSLVYED